MVRAHVVARILDLHLTELVGTYYGMALASVRLSGRLSVGLSAKLVNRIRTQPFQLGPSNLVHLLLMTR